MIVRIAGERQFRVPDSDRESLNNLDNSVVEAVEKDDQQGFRSNFQDLIDLVHDKGEPLPDDELVASDVIIPPADLSLEEAGAEFTGEGLIPD